MLWNPTGHYGPERKANIIYFGEDIKLGWTAHVGYSFLYFGSLSPPDCFMSFSACMSLFLSLEVGSL